MTSAKTQSAASFRLYSVCKLKDGTSSWTDIGAAIPHKDGNGFSFKLSAVPVPGGTFVMRREQQPR